MPEPGSGGAGGSLSQARGGYVAIITLGPRRFVFDSATGEDLGAYAGEYVRQGCIRVMRKDTPLTVYFRPDIGLARLEVVVELGRIWLDGTGFEPANITTPYTCEIQSQGRTVATVNVPYHWWWARWRWQSAPRPVVRSPAVLLQKRLVAPFGRSGLYGGGGGRKEVAWSGPMGTAGIFPAMPATGDRPDIGLVTEIQGEYLIEGSSSALTALLAQGEACGTMPIHWRDEHTAAFVDVFQYPLIAADPDGPGQPKLPALPPYRPGGPGTPLHPGYINYENAHSPAAAYLPFVLTDDPYFLEELEAQATEAIAKYSYARDEYHLPALIPPGQTRGYAWGMRSLFQLGVVAPQQPPRWLKSRDYWRRCIADNLKFVHLYMQSPARVHRVFRAFTVSSKIYTWQNSMMAVVLGTALWMGYEDWRDFSVWFYKGITDMCDGRSGWSRQWPTPYKYLPIRTSGKAVLRLIRDTSLDSQTAASWAEMWDWFKQDNKIDDSGWDGHTLIEKMPGLSYALYLRAALALATHAGIPEAKASYDYIAGQIPVLLQSRWHGGGRRAYRWSIDPA